MASQALFRVMTDFDRIVDGIAFVNDVVPVVGACAGNAAWQCLDAAAATSAGEMLVHYHLPQESD